MSPTELIHLVQAKSYLGPERAQYRVRPARLCVKAPKR